MFIADLHIHSYLSRATSRNLNLEHLNLWAQLKGLRVLGTGDFTHPQWFSELKEKLDEAEPGLFRLKPDISGTSDSQVPPSCRASVRFMLSVEISCIYKRQGRVRKNHNIVFVPDLDSAERFNRALERIGNIRSDGRPILGLDAHDLLDMVLDLSPEAHLIPAHVWTPWFSLFGSKSGFDAMEECFGDLSPHIFAVETGLSSDPPMNWRLSALDGVALVSNSDAHSAPNLGREANIFDTELSYAAMFDALKSRDPRAFLGTIEFFPEEGKYHFDGHRKCNMRMSPAETRESNGLCPKCGRPVTVGVMHRVEELADRDGGVHPEGKLPFRSLLTLPDILAQIKGVAAQTQGVQVEYRRLLEQYGPELSILMDLPLEEIEARGRGLLAEGLRRMRQGEVEIRAGYDGEFGSIVLFTPEERRKLSKQGSLIAFQSRPFASEAARRQEERAESRSIQARGTGGREGNLQPVAPIEPRRDEIDPLLGGLNPEQRKAVVHGEAPLLIVAGPGTGKTLTLTRRIAYLIGRGIAKPEQVLAITFTNKAAQEMRERLATLLDGERGVTVRTFHSLGYAILGEQRRLRGEPATMQILDDVRAQSLLKSVVLSSKPSTSRPGGHGLLEEISRAKQNLLSPESFDSTDPEFASLYRHYEKALQRAGLIDLDDLIVLPLKIWEEDGNVLDNYRVRYRFLFVDEYQDINQAQYRWVRLLSPQGENLCVIGDPDQAIYGFRGADSRYFLRFEEDYRDAEIIRLEQNFRSCEAILQASAKLIGRNDGRPGHRLWSGIPGDPFLITADYPTDRAEAESIVQTIERLMGGTSFFSLDSGRVDGNDAHEGRSFSDFAVFYRLHAQGDVLAEAFEHSGIPFRRIGGESITKNRRVRKVLEVLRRDLKELEGSDSPEPDRVRPPDGEREQSGLGAALRRIVQSLGFDPQEEALETLAIQAEGWAGDVSGFLNQIILRLDLDAFDPQAERVTLMTLHASKGLEFPVVFIAGCESGLLPYTSEGRPATPVEEERRLFYVGLTRAKERVFLTRARRRNLFGRSRVQEASPFLRDIEDRLRNGVTLPRKSRIEKTVNQLNLF